MMNQASTGSNSGGRGSGRSAITTRRGRGWGAARWWAPSVASPAPPSTFSRPSTNGSARRRAADSHSSCRESQYRAYWLSRNERIIERLLGDRSSIICLQYIKSIQLGVAGHPHGLGPKDTNDLWVQVDIDGNGAVDYEKFQQRIWNPKCSEPPEEKTAPGNDGTQMMGERQQTFGFNVKDAVLFPPEVERGMWPENYSLSDHAPLTVVFSPVSIPCGQPIC
ncbi:hypothetical protein BHM03_00025914 [Ensete ventricosum]|nr:hypothetical protein BHM03_00025914 [Ensete ventricosum]